VNKYIAVLLLGLAAGSSIVFSRFVLAEIHPTLLLTIRMGIASGCFLVFLRATRTSLKLDRQVWLDCILVGVLAIGLPLEFSFMSLQHLSSGLFTIFLSFTGMVTMLVAHFLLPDEQSNLVKFLGAGLAFGGVILLIATRSTGLSGQSNGLGYLFALAVVLCFSFGNVYTRRRLRGIDPFLATAIGIGASFILSLPFTLWLSEPGDLGQISFWSWSAALYSSIVGSFLYFGATYWAIKTFGATTAGLVYFVIPVVSALLGAWLLGEIVTATMLAGAALVFIGLVIVNRPELLRNLSRS
jgi:drug/metabolite transporter (DMT)-like permease